jgi:hypothetical protein
VRHRRGLPVRGSAPRPMHALARGRRRLSASSAARSNREVRPHEYSRADIWRTHGRAAYITQSKEGRGQRSGLHSEHV